MSRFETTIIDRSTGSLVRAVLIDGLSEEDVSGVEESWSGMRIATAARLHQCGQAIPEHWHWDWRRKSSKLRLLAYRCFGIECNDVMQGLMMTSTTTHSARLAPDEGKPLVYIEYLEAAPWNLRLMAEEPKFAGIGLRLVECAIRYSQAEGFHGRIGLHSLPQSEAFYAVKCSMISLGADPHMQDLPYFELTRTQADLFLTEEKS